MKAKLMCTEVSVMLELTSAVRFPTARVPLVPASHAYGVNWYSHSSVAGGAGVGISGSAPALVTIGLTSGVLSGVVLPESVAGGFTTSAFFGSLVVATFGAAADEPSAAD